MTSIPNPPRVFCQSDCQLQEPLVQNIYQKEPAIIDFFECSNV